MKLALWLKEIKIDDVPLVGGKNASLGEMYRNLAPLGINIPNGFALTAESYWEFLRNNNLTEKINQIIDRVDAKDVQNLNRASQKIKKMIIQGKFPPEIEKIILENYQQLSREYQVKQVDVAVRSSATAEDLPTASFAGQQETYLNIRGEKNLLSAVKKCWASLFTARAISYRFDQGFDSSKIALSVGIQKMVRSDRAGSGIMFTLDPETGFQNIVLINATYGLGELIVGGKVIPDEYIVFKETLDGQYRPIIKKELGKKRIKMVYGLNGGKTTKIVQTTGKERRKFVLSDEEILTLSAWGVKVEEHYSKRYRCWRPMDIEWAKDGLTGQLFLVQARPETIHNEATLQTFEVYQIKKHNELIVSGAAVGNKIGQGKVRVIKDVKNIRKFKPGEVLVTKMTDPDWEPIMKIASAIVTDEGGRTSHAAIVSRELGVPCIVGTQRATELIKNGQVVTVDCSQGSEGYVWRGESQWVKKIHQVKERKRPVKIMMNLGNPDEAFRLSFLPNDGIGLAREEFIIGSRIKVHPLALIHFDKISDKKTKKEIEEITQGYSSKKDFYVSKLAEGIGTIAAAFYPKEVIVRFSDFKTNEYATLIGGRDFEPAEENPMLGWRGASRYYHPDFKKAFLLECAAIKRVRDVFGLVNVSVMVPFCRTLPEGKLVREIIKDAGLRDLKVYVMCEIPANVLLADEFLDIFDGFSIGSNDLTQLTLGIDRDNQGLRKIADERNEAVKIFIKQAIRKCRERNKYIGICGDAPSTFPEFARFLIETGIKSISLSPDAVLRTIEEIENPPK